MGRSRRGFGIAGFVIAEIVLYGFFKNFQLADYAFMWAAIMLFALLMRIFNVGPTDGPVGVGQNDKDAYGHLAMSFMEKHLRPKYRKEVTSASEDRRAIIGYLVMFIVNCVIVYIYG